MSVDLNFEQARYNMIEQQIRTWDVLDQRVLDAVAATRREDFVPAEFRRLALADTQIPIGRGEVMMAPKVEARMLQSLQIQPGDTALEIGTGSGYVTALLARLTSWVTSVEVYADLSAAAQARLDAAGIGNVTLAVGDALRGWRAPAHFDVVAVTGSVPIMTAALNDHVKVGGRLFIIVGEAPVMEALLLTRTGMESWARESLFETVLPPLVGAVKPRRFAF